MARLLIVEDQDLLARSIGAQVRQLGHEVVGLAHNGREAMALAAEVGPDLVLMDYGLPEIDGATAAATITSTLGVPIVMLTGYADAETVRAADAAGAVGFLVKPVGEVSLGPAICIALGRAGDLRRATERAAALERQLEDRKVIERAKGMLMHRLNLSEEAAYQSLRRESRNQRCRMADLARSVVLMHSSAN